MKMVLLKKTNNFLKFFVVFFLLFLFSFVYLVFASPPSSPYSPGETLNPSCSPNDTNCSVIAPAMSGANSDITSLSGLTTSLSVSQGGTGSSTASGARSNLGLVIGSDIQAYNQYLTDIADITPSQGDIFYFNGTDWANLTAGTSGQFLQTQGAGANPQWVNVTNYWSRSSANLSPAIAGDDILLNSGETLSISDLSQGSLVFAGASGLLSQNNSNLFWNNANNRLGIGTNNPQASLHISGNIYVGTVGSEFIKLISDADSTSYFGEDSSGNEHIWTFRDTGNSQLTINGPDDEIIIGDGSNAYQFRMRDVSSGNLFQFNPNGDAINYFGSTAQDNIWKFRSSGGDLLTIHGPDMEVASNVPFRISGNNKIYFGDDNWFYVYKTASGTIHFQGGDGYFTISDEPVFGTSGGGDYFQMIDVGKVRFYKPIEVRGNSGTNMLSLDGSADSTSYFGEDSSGNEHIWTFRDAGNSQLTINGPDDEIIIGDGSNAYQFRMRDVSSGNLFQFNPNGDAINYFGSTAQDNIWKFRSSGGDLLIVNGPDMEVKVNSSADFFVPTKSVPSSCGTSKKGAIYFDTDDNHFYGCNGTSWTQLDN